ncbi:MAG: ankyrin repeat domain-containing protein [Candidatus Babeliales bacterium]
MDKKTFSAWCALKLFVGVLFFFTQIRAQEEVKLTLDDKLWEAVHQKELDFSAIEALLKRGARSDVKMRKGDCGGDTSLHAALDRALEGDDFSLLNLLLAHKPSLACENRHGKNPLLVAVMYGNLKAAKLLLEHGADVNACRGKSDIELGYEKETPLHSAAGHGDVAMVQLLYTYSAKLEKHSYFAKNFYYDGDYHEAIKDSGKTPLHFAAACTDVQKGFLCAQLLVQLGASLDVEDKKKQTPLHKAALMGNGQLIKFFIEKKISVHKKDLDGETPLFKAVRGAALNSIKLLLAHGAQKNERNERGQTLLHVAATVGQYESDTSQICAVIDFLVQEKIPLDELDSDGVTALYTACAVHEHNSAIIQRLLHHKACVNTGSETPLFAATKRDRRKLIKLLLQHGAKISNPNKAGDTPLHCATDEKTIKLLLKHGAMVDHRNNRGRTALHLMCNSHDYNSAIDYFSCIKVLVEHGADINGSDNHGDTPLCYAASKDNSSYFEIVEYLLQAGACPNRGFPLKFACKDAAKVLIQHGAVVNAQDDRGEAVLHRAAQWYGDDVSYVQFLLASGADYRLQDTEGKTALDYAKKRKNEKIVALLQEIEGVVV